MFDSHTSVINTGHTTHNVSYNSVSGTLVKSTPLSKIIRFHSKSKLAEQYFDSNGPYRITVEQRGTFPHEYKYDVQIPVTILQIMLMANDELLIEYIDNE